jgi:hypothetical protein
MPAYFPALSPFENTLTFVMLDNPLPDKIEYVAVDRIPWESVIGWYDTFQTRDTDKNKISDAVYHDNPAYDPELFPRLEDGGSRPRLAGFPKAHPAWSRSPWKDSKDEKCDRSAVTSRRALENRRDEDMFPTTEDKHLIARKGRSLKTGGSTRARKHKTPPKKTTRKKTSTKTTPETNKCTAKMAKAGKGCTANMKKQGKCPAQQCAYDPNKETKRQYLLKYRKIAATGKVPPKDKPTTGSSKKSTGGKAKTRYIRGLEGASSIPRSY